MFCFFLKVFIRSIPSSTQEPKVYDSCEVKFEYISGNIYIYVYFAGYVWCP